MREKKKLMKGLPKRILTFVMAVAMVLTVMPYDGMVAFAATACPDCNGTGHTAVACTASNCENGTLYGACSCEAGQITCTKCNGNGKYLCTASENHMLPPDESGAGDPQCEYCHEFVTDAPGYIFDCPYTEDCPECENGKKNLGDCEKCIDGFEICLTCNGAGTIHDCISLTGISETEIWHSDWDNYGNTIIAVTTDDASHPTVSIDTGSGDTTWSDIVYKCDSDGNIKSEYLGDFGFRARFGEVYTGEDYADWMEVTSGKIVLHSEGYNADLLTLEINFSDADNNDYTLKYEAHTITYYEPKTQGSSEWNVMTAVLYAPIENTSQTSSTPDYAPTGKEFIGWTTTAGGTTPYTFGSPLTENIELYPIWGDHTHTWGYTADDNVITATCSNTSHTATLTLTAPNAVNTGSSYAGATVEWSIEDENLATPVLTYKGRGDTSYTESPTAPTASGTYTVVATVDDKTMSADFEIGLSISDVVEKIKAVGDRLVVEFMGSEIDFATMVEGDVDAFFDLDNYSWIFSLNEEGKYVFDSSNIQETVYNFYITYKNGLVEKLVMDGGDMAFEFIYRHPHSFTYSATGNIITATCSNEDNKCDLDDGTGAHKVSLTLAANNANYSSDAYTGVEIKDSEDNPISDTANNLWIKAGIDAPTVEYKVNDTWGTTAPTEVGTYQVRMYPSGETQTDDNTVVAEFSINKIAIDAVTFTEPTVAAKGTPATATELAIDENANYTGEISWSPAAESFGYNTAYTATVTLTAKDNYEFASEVSTLEGWTKSSTSTDTSLVLTKTYDNTAKAKITSVTPPSVTTELTALTTKDAQLEALAEEASKVAVTVEDNSETSMAITWALKADTTYSTVSEDENIFVWTVTETEYANYDTNSKALTGEVTIKNPAHVHEVDNDKKTDAFAGNCVEKATAEWYACTDTTCDKKLDKDGNEIENIEGELNSDVHMSSETTYDNTAETHTLKYACCGAVKEEAKAHTYGDTASERYTCTVCSYENETKKAAAELADTKEAANAAIDEAVALDTAENVVQAATDAKTAIAAAETGEAVTEAKENGIGAINTAKLANAKETANTAIDEEAGSKNELQKVKDAKAAAKEAIESAETVDAVTAAKDAGIQAIKIANVEGLIDKIGEPINSASGFGINKARAAYDALTDDQKKLVTNYGKLEEAEEVYEKIKADTDAKNSVCKLIGAIGEVEYTDACKARIDKARAAYDELNDELKAQISLNYADLVKAETKYEELKAAADKAAADEVTDKIKAIKEPITLDKEADIKAARTAYDALTADQKELVSVVGMLEDAEAALAARKLNKVSASWTSASQANGKITFVKAEREGNPLTDKNKGQEFNYTANSITAMKGDVVTLSLVPNYGYQVSSTWAKANGVAALEKVSEFAIPVNTNLNFKDVFVKASNEVIVNSKYVASANIKNGNNATNTGTLRFKVVDNSDYSKDVTKVVDIEEGQKIEKVASLELDLNSLVGKGAPDINWDNSVKEFDKNINVELKLKNITLEDGATLSVVREHNGTLKQLDSTYDSKTGVLTFATNRFSTYTIVKKVNVKKDIVVSQLRIDPKSVVLTTKGETNTLKVIFNPSNATNKAVTWTSSDTSVVKVDANGKITAVANGTAVITATSKSNPMATSKCNVTVKLSKVSVAYQTHIQTYGDSQGFKKDGEMAGTSGEAKRLESLKVKISGNPNLGIAYTTHVQTYGWLPWSHNGEASGTSGEAKRMEALKIQLKGADASKYDVYYRVHAQTYGWLNWAKNGEAAGTAGLAKRLEGIQIVVVEKGKTFNQNMGNIKSTNAKAFIQGTSATTEPVKYDEPTPNVMYKTHVQTFGWQNWKTNGAMSGTSGLAKRLEGINIKLTNAPYAGGIRYMTHVQSFGWEKAWRADGAMSGTSGLAKRLEGIRIELTGEMAKHYDVYYRVHAQSFGWLGWAKNGESAGTEGLAKRLEGIQIILVKKGDKAPAANYGGITSKTSKPFIKK